MCANETLNKASATKNISFFGDVCLLGLGVTGRAVVDFFLRNPDSLKSLTIYCGRIEQGNQAYLRSLPETVVVHQNTEDITGSYDIAVVSPGIPPGSALYRNAARASTEIISEPELAWRIAPQKWIAVTGTNGKTTVTELIAALLDSAGRTAWTAGNIGRPCIEVISSREDEDWLVAELSSYQLHSTVHFAPAAAVLLNITPDHLSWHGTQENYRRDKERILANLPEDAPAIIDVTLPETRAIASEAYDAGRRVIPIGSSQGLMLDRVQHPVEIGYIDATSSELILVLEHAAFVLLRSGELHIKGPHNMSNALAAAAAVAAVEKQITADELAHGLMGFYPLPHRFEPCGQIEGISFVNDSKATNIDASIKALSSFSDDAQTRTVVALFGGIDKGTDLEELVKAAKGPCVCAVCYGEAGERFYHAFLKGSVPAELVKTFDEAFELAFDLAKTGNTILLSPACASFDEFDSFEARGDHFKACVEDLAKRREASS